MSREDPVPSALHFRIEPDDRRVLERIARHERTTVSQLLRKIVADWIRSQQNPNPVRIAALPQPGAALRPTVLR